MRRSVVPVPVLPALLAVAVLWPGAAVPAIAGEWSSNAEYPWAATNPDFPGFAVPLDSLGGPPRVLSWEVDYRYEDIAYLRYYGGSAGTSIQVAAWHVAVIDTGTGTILADYVETVSEDGREEFADVEYGVYTIIVFEPPLWTDNTGGDRQPVVLSVRIRPGPDDYGPEYGLHPCLDCGEE